MTSSQIRQSFLDFFKSKQHTIVPSSSLLPDSPNLLFTNAGMNQFVPIFLGQVKCPYQPPRAADTQKCIRAGGKHNDLDDVGLDTYHHTFFEMLGNWSFGDYFKKEAIDWAWELVTEIWKFPKNRLYATVYSPDKSQNDPSDFDQEAYDLWATKFTAAGLDPKIHIVFGNKKDNFWMMGETGPCGPCSELHVDLTPAGDTQGSLVNKGDARCIEIWNLVFIQFNANPDGTFSPLPAKHVDTGMGFERATSIIQCTKNFTDFTGIISNYETDIFRPIFNRLEKMSGKKYSSTLPGMPAPIPGEHTRPRVSQSAPSPIASKTSGVKETTYSRRNLPHFERPWAKYFVTFSTHERRQLAPAERDLVFKSVLYAHEHRQYQLYAACVMPDHVHLLFEPQIKKQDKDGNPVFWSLSEILQGVKSASAHEINKASGQKGTVWEKESMDRMIRGQSDMEEKFHYICRNPWDAGVASTAEPYPWLWTPEGGPGAQAAESSGEHTRPRVSLTAPSRSASETVGEAPTAAREGACAPRDGEQEKIDIAFRVIADHIRTLSFAIADGIQPGNTDRNYVLRRILRRAVRYGRTLGFHEPFFYKLVDVLVDTMSDVFPEIRAKRDYVQEVIRREEEAFNKTLDRGIEIIEQVIQSREKLGQRLYQLLHDLEAFYNSPELRIENIAPSQQRRFFEKIGERLSPEIFSHGVEFKKIPEGSMFFMPAEEVIHAISPLMEAKSRFEELASSEPAYLAIWNDLPQNLKEAQKKLLLILNQPQKINGTAAFVLYDTYGFPIDLTELIARERGLIVAKDGFEMLMEQQRTRARAAQKKEVISLSQIETTTPTKFVGFDQLETDAKVVEVVSMKDKTAVILDTSPAYAEMGGQVGDTGELSGAGQLWRIVNTQKTGNTFLHFIEDSTRAAVLLGEHTRPRVSQSAPSPIASARAEDEVISTPTSGRETSSLPIPGSNVTLSVDSPRRNAIQRHHTVTHLLHWALHEVVSKEASQKGSFVGPDKLTFDFNSAALTPEQVSDIEKLVNERILENAGVSWIEVPYTDVKSRKDVMQFFGDKYGDKVRVVQIGGRAGELDGYSMELCGGTHTRATGEIGLFRILGESAVAAGVRRIEAIAGLQAYQKTKHDAELIGSVADKVNSPVAELEKKIDALLAQQKELEKSLRAAKQKEAAGDAKTLLAKAETINGIPAIITNIPSADGDTLQTIADALKSQFKGVIVLGGAANGAVSLVAAVSPDFTAKVQAGKIIQAIAPMVGGKGGGKPDNARGGGKDTAKLDEALAKAKSLLG